MTTHTNDLGDTLRTRRNRISPAAAGLPRGHARRALGLRREDRTLPKDRRLINLIQKLNKAISICRPLDLGRCQPHRDDRNVMVHPAVGPTTVDCDALTNGDAELKIVIRAAAPDTEDGSKFRLALVSGVSDLAHS